MNISRRRTITLVKWWRELNGFGWPKELGQKPEQQEFLKVAVARMEEIQKEIGLRFILKKC